MIVVLCSCHVQITCGCNLPWCVLLEESSFRLLSSRKVPCPRGVLWAQNPWWCRGLIPARTRQTAAFLTTFWRFSQFQARQPRWFPLWPTAPCFFLMPDVGVIANEHVIDDVFSIFLQVSNFSFYSRGANFSAFGKSWEVLAISIISM